jgi:hypothetical protein
MALVISDTGGGDYTPAPEGTHFGVCDMVVDLGHQRTTYLGAETIKKQVYIRWQVPAERIEWTDGTGAKHEGPMVIGKTYTASLSEKANLRKDLQSWRGRIFSEDELKGFDISNLLAKPATITVTHKESNGKTYANIASVGGIPKGMTAPPVEGATLLFDTDAPDNITMLPKWLREKVEGRVPPPGEADPPEQRGGVPAGQEGHIPGFDSDLDDDVPF